MISKRRKCLYLARIQEDKDLGVVRKISEFNKALGFKGFNVVCHFIPPSLSIVSTIRDVYLLKRYSGIDILILRSFYTLDICLIPLFILLRLRKVSIVIDFPVPRKIALKEVRVDRRGVGLLRWMLLHFISGPWCYWLATKLIHYAGESSYLAFWNTKKSLLTGNGISKSRFSLREKKPVWPHSTMNLVFVGFLQNHHGVDRLLMACCKFNQQVDNSFKIKVNVVGNGPLLSDLQSLSKKLGIEQYVNFTGSLKGDSLLQVYESSHAAVSSLGLHRLNLDVASVLKAREYCLVGIPFIACGKDVDFSASLPFRVEVSPDEDLDSLCSAFKNLADSLEYINDREINDYALRNLTFESKIEEIGKPFN